MRILVLGASGFIGYKLVDRLLSDAELGDAAITELILADEVAPTMPLEESGFDVKTLKVDITDSQCVDMLISSRPDVIFHLANVLSSDAEYDFDKGYKVNVDGSRKLLEAIRLADDYKPRLIYASSLDVFGLPTPDVILDDLACTPVSSFGSQKAIVELLINDYSRKGFLNGTSLRLPTIIIRPGQPSMETSSFLSSIVSEPLANMEAICPVPLSTRHPVASPRSAVGFLVRAATLTPEEMSDGRTITMPGLSVTVGEIIESLARVTGKHAVEMIKHVPDPHIQKIVMGWPQHLDAKRALSLGFEVEANIDEIIETYIDDDLGGWKYHLPSDMRLKPLSESNWKKKKNVGHAA